MFTTACSKDNCGKDKLCTNLYSDYSASLDFLVSDKEKNTQGKADVQKADTTTVTFTEPDFFRGISVKSDNTGKEDTFIFEFSGIPASVPKSITSDISLIFSLFSDELAAKIDALPPECFRKSVSSGKNEDLYEAFFSQNGINYSIIYNRQNGIPVSIDAGNDTLSVSIIFSDFNLIKQQ